jgi:cyclopropane fatty-acyl-phospholipid synthase-like methyltransferase
MNGSIFTFDLRPLKFLPQNPPFYFCNFGYWKNTNKFHEANFDLAIFLGKLSNIDLNSNLLEVGFGFGGSIRIWREYFGVERIDGRNLSKIQTEFAIQSLNDLNPSPNLIQGDESYIPMPRDQYTHIICLDCIYHFKNRVTFFKNSNEISSIHGKLVYTDFVINKKSKFLEWILKSMEIDKKSILSLMDQTEISSQTGWEIEYFEDITSHTLMGFIEERKKAGLIWNVISLLFEFLIKNYEIKYFIFILKKNKILKNY